MMLGHVGWGYDVHLPHVSLCDMNIFQYMSQDQFLYPNYTCRLNHSGWKGGLWWKPFHGKFTSCPNISLEQKCDWSLRLLRTSPELVLTGPCWSSKVTKA